MAKWAQPVGFKFHDGDPTAQFAYPEILARPQRPRHCSGRGARRFHGVQILRRRRGARMSKRTFAIFLDYAKSARLISLMSVGLIGLPNKVFQKKPSSGLMSFTKTLCLFQRLFRAPTGVFGWVLFQHWKKQRASISLDFFDLIWSKA